VVLVDGLQQHILIVLVGDIFDHERSSSVQAGGYPA
jgi:hypothetical protein